ncbi:MAG: SpoIID/LytB domain-containing protein, partial [candidate division Zixibacteria bacterium]|nr:SpoIID/LytB domain-containing protein [candidate division Zixibacteria bacterium]
EIYYSNQPVTIINHRRTLTVENKNNTPLREGLDEVNIIPRGPGNRLQLDRYRYRGIMKLLPTGQTVQLINIVYMEDYLRGVVPPEIGKRTDSEIEAVKAQAVAARTYALAHLQQYPAEEYDMKSSIMDQIYQGMTVENRLTNRSIDATAGQAITFDDQFINAYYHSTCGGMTDDIESVWDRKETPYLKAVEDSGACSWSKYYTWKEVFTERQLRGRIEQYLSSDRGRDMVIGRITDVESSERTPGGRVKTLIVKTARDSYRFKKDRIRWVIGRTSNPDLILPSDRFDVVIGRDASGQLESVTFNGRGYGHGVGMCQCGAIGLARQGWSFDKILKHYFTGVDVLKMY